MFLGEYCNPKEKIDYYLKIFKDTIKIENNTINIRLAGDSTNNGKNLSVLNFSFGFLNEIDHPEETNPNAVTGNFALGVFKIKSECYEQLHIALKEIIEKLSSLKATRLNGIDHNIIFWLGGDLKFLALALGMYCNLNLLIY